jgi:hypothetical protein
MIGIGSCSIDGADVADHDIAIVAVMVIAIAMTMALLEIARDHVALLQLWLDVAPHV